MDCNQQTLIRRYLPNVHSIRVANYDQNEAEKEWMQEVGNAVSLVNNGANEE
jgi:hypothetical protein